MTSIEYLLKRSVMSRSKLAIIIKDEDDVTQFCCVECPLRYTEKEELEKHLCTHYQEYKFLCGICGTGLKRKEHLDRHMLGHQEVRPHVCEECGKGFKRKEHLNIHKSIHSGEKGEQCTLCNKSFYRKDHLQKHLQTHSKAFVDKNGQLFGEELNIKEEPMNGDDANDASEMQSLIMNYSNFVNVKMETPETDDSQQDNEGISDVDQGYNSAGFGVTIHNERPYVCCVCKKSYKRKDHLKIHSWTHLKKDKICSECGEGFHKDEQLLTHMNTHLKQYSDYNAKDDWNIPNRKNVKLENDYIIDETSTYMPRKSQITDYRPHECPVCHRKFKRKQHLKVHANIHLRNQSTVCSHCNEAFSSTNQLENHVCPVSTLNSNEYILPIDREPQWEEPQKQAKKENEMPHEYINIIPEEHLIEPPMEEMLNIAIMQDSTPPPAPCEESDLPVPQRVYVCKFCTKTFKRKDHFKIHQHIHTGVKSFFCPHCGKGFYRKDHMQKHMLIHKPKTDRKKELPDLFPISMLAGSSASSTNDAVKPEITIRAPASSKLRVPLQMKVPYQMVVSLENGERRSLNVTPRDS